MTNERGKFDFSELQMPTMTLHGIEQPAYAISREIARGANGVVFECTNLLLARREAMKVWAQFRENDDRDKIQQGLLEAQAAANAAGDAVVKIFAAGTLPNGMFYCTMEFVQGQTLKQFLAEGRSRSERIALAQHYLSALQIAEEAGVVHGDAHLKNVLIEENSSGGELRLLDFGTSKFSKAGNSLRRHYAIIEQTLHHIFEVERSKFGLSRSLRQRSGSSMVLTRHSSRDERYAAYYEHVYGMNYLPLDIDVRLTL